MPRLFQTSSTLLLKQHSKYFIWESSCRHGLCPEEMTEEISLRTHCSRLIPLALDKLTLWRVSTVIRSPTLDTPRSSWTLHLFPLKSKASYNYHWDSALSLQFLWLWLASDPSVVPFEVSIHTSLPCGSNWGSHSLIFAPVKILYLSQTKFLW